MYIGLKQKASFHDFPCIHIGAQALMEEMHIVLSTKCSEHIEGNTKPLHIGLSSQKHISIYTSNFLVQKCDLHAAY